MSVKQLIPGTLCNIVKIVPTGGNAPDSIWGRRIYSIPSTQQTGAGPRCPLWTDETARMMVGGGRQIDKFDMDYINRSDVIMYVDQWNETYSEVFVSGKFYAVLSGYLEPL